MGRKKSKKPQLKWRVVKDIAAILGISLFISAICGFFYFKWVVCKQEISNEKAKQLQLSNQLTFMAEDIQQFSESILVDEQLQELLEETAESEYEKTRKYDRISRRLMFYSNLRSYISNTILLMTDGSSYGSNYQIHEINSFNSKLDISSLSLHFSERSHIYSDPYVSSDREMICYQIPLLSKYQYNKHIGILYMEIYLDYFLDQVDLYANAYDTVCLIGNGQQFLYEKDTHKIVQQFLNNEHTVKNDGVYQIKNGYLICTDIATTGWQLCTLLPESQIWQSSRFVLKFFLISFLFSIGMVVIFGSKIMERIVRPVVRLSSQMEKDDYGNLDHIEMVHTGDEIETLYVCYCMMIEKIHEEERIRIEHEKNKKEMEFAIMHSQIAPHYLYNVLNTVMYLAAAEKNTKIVDIVRALIYTLQETLDIGGEHLETTIAKELELTKAYLDIQKYRYANKFHSNIVCEDTLKNYVVPKTIIQPLVENALVHGILPTRRIGTLMVHVYQSDQRLLIEVEDDGIGIEESYLEKYGERQWEDCEMNTNDSIKKDGRRHIGIDNVKNRIRYLYGKDYGLKIEKKIDGGTRIRMYLPLIKKEETE